MLEGVKDLLWGNSFNRITEGLDEVVQRLRPKRFDKGFELGEKVFDGVQVG